ncbi:MAG: SRPBCC family protein [Gammaproteobacteria bacterium]
MPTCKQKINASPDQIFNYLSDLQNVVDLYKDKYPITTVKDLGSACYGKKYQYEVENKHSTSLRKQTFTVEIIEYEPFESIAWSVEFERSTKVNKNTTYIPTTVLLNCRLMPKNDYTLAMLDVDFEMQAAWWIKFLFRTMTRLFQSKICHVWHDIRKDIELKTP